MITPALIGGLGPTELVIILVIVLVLFGAGRLPQVFESVGKGIKQFRDAQRDEPRDVTPRSLPDGGDEVPLHESERQHAER